MSFEGQTVVVTGGTRGLGAAMSRAFLEAGARVHATYRSDEGAAAAFAVSCAGARDSLELHRFDVADPGAVSAFWETLERDEPGGVHVLVNNSGIRKDAILPLMSVEDWQSVLATNLTGGFLMSKHAVQQMLPRRYGRILFVTSPSGRLGFEGQGNYAASKAGQVGLARSLAREVARRGITVNCVSPGFIDTELIGDLGEEQRKAWLASVPMRRFGTPQEVAHAVLFLASDEAAYITGTTLIVDGGWTAR